MQDAERIHKLRADLQRQVYATTCKKVQNDGPQQRVDFSRPVVNTTGQLLVALNCVGQEQRMFAGECVSGEAQTCWGNTR